MTFAQEGTLAKLSNLATHAKDCSSKIAQIRAASSSLSEAKKSTLVESVNHKRSIDIMAEFLREGELNPQIVPTRKGFLRVFSAWVIDESLPWTTGESPMLQALFKYLKIQYNPPSDTTVRAQLRSIFLELKEKIIFEFAVRGYFPI